MNENPQIELDKALLADMNEVALVFRASFRHALPFIPEIHTPDEDRSFFAERVFSENEVFIAREQNSKTIVGFIAFDDHSINHLYLLPQWRGCGLGDKLLQLALIKHEDLWLWAFQANTPAIRFYERHGFTIVKTTDGSDNEEKQPDVLMRRQISLQQETNQS